MHTALGLYSTRSHPCKQKPPHPSKHVAFRFTVFHKSGCLTWFPFFVINLLETCQSARAFIYNRWSPICTCKMQRRKWTL